MGWFDHKQQQQPGESEPDTPTVPALPFPPGAYQQQDGFHSSPTLRPEQMTMPVLPPQSPYGQPPIEPTVTVPPLVLPSVQGLPVPQPPAHHNNYAPPYEATQRSAPMPTLPSLAEVKQREKEWQAQQRYEQQQQMQQMQPPAALPPYPMQQPPQAQPQPARQEPAEQKPQVSFGTRFVRAVTPSLVALLLGGIQLLFLARFILRFLQITGDQVSWVPLLYQIADLFVWPFYLLWQFVPWQLPPHVELYTLAGMFILMLLSRPLVGWMRRRNKRLNEQGR